MATKTSKISVAIAVFNEEKNIRACLTSVSGWADEIVVVDGGSSDKTVSLARSFGAKVIKTDNPPIFHINKQKALDACSGDWILQLDADEVLTHELKQEITHIVQDPSAKPGYAIPRKNYFWGTFMKKGGQYPDYVVRLFKRGVGRFPMKSVHEQILIEGEIGHTKNPMLHFSYRTRDDYWRKADSYTSLTANEFVRDRVARTFFSYVLYMFIKPVGTFLSLFVRHKGFLDGLAGLEFALYSSMHWPIAYRKFLEFKGTI